MKIQTVEFVKGVIGSEGLPEKKRPTIAFLGRSNVGKSSVLNTLFRKKIAKSSATPGRTTEINYFLVNDAFYCADLPGYGYARLPIGKREKIRKLILWFIGDENVSLDLTVLVFDVSVGMKETDVEMTVLLQECGRNVFLLGNKMDKGGKNANRKHLEEVRRMFPDLPLLSFSAKTSEGKTEFLSVLEMALGEV